MLSKFWDKVVRLRTWIVNILLGIIITPDLILAIVGFDWSFIIPPKYLPFITLASVVLNVWMRPRPAVRKKDVDEDPDWDNGQ